MWLGTDLVFDAFKFYVCETPYGVMQVHGYPYDARAQHLHRRDARGRLAARRLRRVRRAQPSRPGSATRSRSRGSREICSPTCSTGTRCSPTTRSGSASPPSATNAGGTATSCCSATPRTPRTSPSARAPSWRWRTRSRWPPACTSSPDVADGAGRLRGRAAAGRRSPPSARRRPAWSGSRTSASTSDQDPSSSRFNIAHPQPPDHLRQPAAARPGVRRARGRLVRRRAAAPARCAPPMFQPFRLGAAGADEPGRRLADGHVLGRRRHAERLPPRPPRRQGARRRRPGDDRDGLRLARRAGSPPAAPASAPTSRRRPGRRIVDFVHARSAAPRSACSSATPAARARPS